MNQDSINCVIVDDELLARNFIRECLQKHADIQILAEYGDPLKANTFLKSNSCDLLFLDIQMPELNGFDLMEKIKNPPLIIFCTAYDEYAIKAFEANAIDYLLKPFDQERFDSAILKAKKYLKGEQDYPNLKHLLQFIKNEKTEIPKLLVKDGDQLIVITPLDIFWAEAQEDYSLLHCKSNNYLVSRSLQELEQRFSSYTFKRIHRSALVNFEMVKEIHPWSSGRYLLKMKNGDEIESSKSGARLIRNMLL